MLLAFVVHGIAALAIILVLLVIFVLGVVSLFRLTGRGIRKARDQL
jgi:cbb3-type cytochrome oxidase subunit 3